MTTRRLNDIYGVGRHFGSKFSLHLFLLHVRLFFGFVVVLCLCLIGLTSLRLISAPQIGLSQQPFLFFGALVASIIGLFQCRRHDPFTCPKHMTQIASKRLRRSMFCVPIIVTLFTLASIPTPGSNKAAVLSSLELALHLSGCTPAGNNSELNLIRVYAVTAGDAVEISSHGLWPLLCLCAAVQALLSGIVRPKLRLTLCASLAVVHTVMVAITRLSLVASLTKQYLCPMDGILQPREWMSRAEIHWNGEAIQFWRNVLSNNVAFGLVILISWRLARESAIEHWRCYCVMLCSGVRKSLLLRAHEKLVSSQTVST